MKDHRYRGKPRIVSGGAGRLEVLHQAACSCGWVSPSSLPYADVSYRVWETHRSEVRRARDEQPPR